MRVRRLNHYATKPPVNAYTVANYLVYVLEVSPVLALMTVSVVGRLKMQDLADIDRPNCRR